MKRIELKIEVRWCFLRKYDRDKRRAKKREMWVK